MSKKKPIKPRSVWKINPKTRVKPNKKKHVTIDDICDICNGAGFDAYEIKCEDCGGTGLI